jgi:hypothetical protein
VVEFLSVLIGLYVGVHPVELAVATEVAAVEIRLDGKLLTVLSEPPWTFDCDFGANPVPHELVASARNARGEEIDRVSRWINLADSPAAASMTFETGDGGRPVAVRISWESIGVRQPHAVELLFDGEPLEFADPRRVPLPPFDPHEIHFVSAKLRFTDEQISRLEASFGGALGEEVRTELTAVAVVLERRGALPPVAMLQDWFTKDGAPLAVHGVEKGSAEVIFVRDPTVQAHLERLGDLALREATGTATGRPRPIATSSTQRRSQGKPAPDQLRRLAWLGKDVYLQFLAPGAAPLLGDDLIPEIFPHSPAYGADDGGFLRISQQPTEMAFPIHFADAVAIAGMAAHGTHERRAVVALLGETPGDRSQHSIEAVSSYLRQLHVPLAVWRFTDESTRSEWPEARFVGPRPGDRKVPERFREALADLRRTLRRQRVVWLEGRHLPQHIELAPAARGIRLAGR